jgi:phosphopantetheinyl transferase (holo-ACP synthase)
MLGNDVVDLADPETRPETFRPRFAERVFDLGERRAIAKDPEPHARQWAHWGAKEAAYKLARQVDPSFIFSPIKLVARFEPPVPGSASQLERHGTLVLPQAVAPGLRELELRSEETPDCVHVRALPVGADWGAVVSAVELAPKGMDSSVAVRDLATEVIARDLGIEAARVSIGRRGKIPTVQIDGALCTMGISLSHHGRFVACAMMLRTQATVDAPDWSVGVEGVGRFEAARRWA